MRVVGVRTVRQRNQSDLKVRRTETMGDTRTSECSLSESKEEILILDSYHG